MQRQNICRYAEAGAARYPCQTPKTRPSPSRLYPRSPLVPGLSLLKDPPASEIFNKFVRNITAVHTRRIVMSSIDRVSGGLMAVMFGGIALLCGSLLFAALGQ